MTNYELLITTIRELVLDLNPVMAFTAKKQGLSFSVTATGVVFDAEPEIPFSELPKIYNLASYFTVDKSAEVSFPDIYIPLEYSSGLVAKDYGELFDTDKGKDIYSKNFFSDATIDTVIYDWFNFRYSGCGTGRFCDKEDYYLTVDPTEEFSDYEMYELQLIALWVSYYLLEKKKAIIYSSDAVKSGLGYTEEEFLNTDKSITTRINDVFTIQENPKAADSNNEISSIWGDKDMFITKLQLYLRNKYENLCGDYSLRTDKVAQTSSVLDKHWFPYAHDYKKQTNQLSRTILFENR